MVAPPLDVQAGALEVHRAAPVDQRHHLRVQGVGGGGPRQGKAPHAEWDHGKVPSMAEVEVH